MACILCEAKNEDIIFKNSFLRVILVIIMNFIIEIKIVCKRYEKVRRKESSS